MAGWRIHVLDNHDNGVVDYDETYIHGGSISESGSTLTLVSDTWSWIGGDTGVNLANYHFGAVGAGYLWRSTVKIDSYNSPASGRGVFPAGHRVSRGRSRDPIPWSNPPDRAPVRSQPPRSPTLSNGARGRRHPEPRGASWRSARFS